MDELTERESELLRKYGSFYQSLLIGDIPADTPEGIHFLRVFKRGYAPKTEHEIAYKKYLSLQSRRASEAEIDKRLAEIEKCPAGCRPYSAQMNDKLAIRYEPNDPPWEDPFRYG